MRLDKYLADMHLGSRQEVKEQIRKGLILVDQKVCKDPGMKIDPEHNTVTAGGKELRYQAQHYYMLNKPGGILSATEDTRQGTVLDLFPEKLRRGLFPVGRLDKDTVGLLIITDDGELSHRLLSPKYHVDKTYFLRTDLPMEERDVKCFAAGMELGDGTVLKSADLKLSADPMEAEITIREGKYHQIKRMLEERGKKVIYLKRLSMGGLNLDPKLQEGEYRELTEAEILILRTAAEN